ncbi:unnamed protein product [Urochloa humidicola]
MWVIELTNNLDKERSIAAEEKERLVSENSLYLNELEKARSSVKDLEKKLESTKNSLNSNIVELQKEKNSTMSEIEELEASLINLKTELAQQLERVSDMQKTNAGLELANSNLHNEIVNVQGQKSEVVAAIIDLKSKLEQQAHDISTLEEVNNDLKTAKTNLYNEVTTLQKEKNVALSQLQQSEANINNLQSDFKLRENQILFLQQENEELQNKNSSLHKQLEEIRANLQDDIVVLQGEKEEAITSLHQSNDLVKAIGIQLEHQVKQISVLQLANEDLQNSNSNLKMQLDEAKLRDQGEILALQDEKNKILLDLQKAEASIMNLRIELEQGKEQILILNLANEDLKNDIDILNKQLEVRSSLHAEIKQLNVEKITTLLELQTSRGLLTNLESVLEKQSEKISTLDQANGELQRNICTLTEQSEQTKVELQKEVEASQEEKGTMLTQLKQSKTLVHILENKVTQLKEELSVQLEKYSTLDKQLVEVRSSMHAKITELCAEKDVYLLELETSQASIKNLEIALQAHNESMSTLQQANDELHNKFCTLTKQLEQAKAKLQEDVKATQQEKDAVLTRLKQSEETMENLENEVTRLRDELSVQQGNNFTLDKQLREVRNTMGAEIEELHKEKEASLLELHASRASINDHENALQRYNEIISTLQQVNDELHKNTCTLTKQLEQDKAGLQQEVKATLEEKNVVLTQLNKSEELVQNLENEVKQLKGELSVELENNSITDKQLEEVRSSMSAKIAEHHAEKDAYLLELHASQDSIRDFEIVIQTHNENISTLQQANDELQKNIRTLTEQAEQYKVGLQQEVKATQEEKDAVLKKLKQSKEIEQNLENVVKRQWDQLLVQLKNNSTLDKQLEELRNNMGAKITELHLEKDAYLLELQASQAYVRDLEISLQTHSENISSLQQANDELQKNISTLTNHSEQAKADLQQEIKATQEEMDVVLTHLKKSEESVQNLENEVKQLKDELSIQQKNNSTLDNQLEELRSSMGAKIVELNAEKDASLLKLEASQAYVGYLEISLQTHNENISTLQQANDELQKNICTLTEQSEQAKARMQQDVKDTQEAKDAVLTQLKKSEELVQNLENEVEQLKGEYSIQLEKNFILDKQLEEVRSNMGAEIAEHRAGKNASILELQASQAFVRDLEIVVQTHNENISTLQQANDELQKNICTMIEKSEQDKTRLQQEVKAIQEEKDAVVTKLMESKELVQNIENDVSRLRDELSVQLENNSTLDNQLREVRNTMGAEIEELLTELHAEKVASLLELQSSQASIRDLEIVLQMHNESISTLQQANDELQNNICTLIEQSEEFKSKLQQELNATQEEKDAVVTQLKQSEQLVQNLGSKVTRLRDELSIQLENNSTLDKQLEQVRSNMGAEIAKLRIEKETSLLELQASQASIRELEIALQMDNKNISTLQQANDELKKNNCTLTEQSKQIKVKLQQEIKATQEAKHAMLTQLKQFEESIQNLEDEMTRLKDELLVQLQKNSSLDKQKQRWSSGMIGC